MKLFTKNPKQQARQPKLMNGQTDDYTFRRSRTLTGTTSVKIATPAGHNSQLKTTRLQAHELHGHRQKIVRLLAASLVVCGVLGGLIGNFIQEPVIVTASPSATPIPATAYRQSIDRYFERHPLERFGVFLNELNLQDYMLSQHSELRDFRSNVTLMNSHPTFTVGFRQPVLVWQTAQQQFFVDDTGVAFTFDYAQGAYVAVKDQSGVTAEVGGPVASGRFITFLGRLVGAVNREEKGGVVSITIPPAAREVDLTLQGRDYVIKTHLDREVHEQAEDMARAITWFESRSIKPQYIDVRVPNKAFYK